MIRFALLLVCVGLYLIGSGCYDLFVQAGASRQPTTVSIADLEKAVPANRHLVITGGRAVPTTAVKFYRTHWGTKVSGSEILFIPVVDASATNLDRSTPSVLLRVTEDQIDAAKTGQKIDFRALEGVRTTSMDLEDKARQRLVDTYGQAAVDRMMILVYHGSVGIAPALGKLAGGLALTGALVGLFILGRKSKQSPPPIATSIPPPIPR
jgi:hypothetical protein